MQKEEMETGSQWMCVVVHVCSKGFWTSPSPSEERIGRPGHGSGGGSGGTSEGMWPVTGPRTSNRPINCSVSSPRLALAVVGLRCDAIMTAWPV